LVSVKPMSLMYGAEAELARNLVTYDKTKGTP
jgi:hypothetical protein